MSALRLLARALSERLGREGRVVRALRPLYDAWLDVSTGGRGIEIPINGRECVRIDPYQRRHIPERYDPEVMDWLRSRVKPGSVCLNVGAHMGIYALCLARWTGETGRVVAFEPNPATRAVLKKHVALNRLEGVIEVREEAVSESSGTAKFLADGREGTSKLGRLNPDAPAGTEIEVPLVTLDEFCQARGLVPDWIVIDVEGFEGAALSGARRTIRSAPGGIGVVCEMHPRLWEGAGTSRDAVASLLESLGLTARALTGQSDPLGEYGIVSLEPARRS